MAIAIAPLLDSFNPYLGTTSGTKAFFEKPLAPLLLKQDEKEEEEEEEEEDVEDLIPAEMERKRTLAIATHKP